MGSRTSGVLPLIAIMIVILATGSALAQSWNFYSSLGQSTTLNFNTAMSANQDATLNVKVGNTSLGSIPMDTGSNGILSSAFVPTAGDTYLGPGTETLTSSKITYNGNLYQTTVTIGSGANTVTSKVTVLQVTSITSAACPQGCAPGTVAYMGVGFNRGVSTVTALTPGTLINTNPFINVTAINGTAVTNLQQGYIISSTGVTLGLNSTNTQNYAFVKLMPDTSPSPSSQAGTVWQQAPATVVVNGVAGSGTILPDSGIGYSYLTPPKYVGQTPCPTPPGGACLPSSATVMIYLPGQTTPQLAMYSLTDPGSPLSPGVIAINPPSSTTFVNTGRLFYLGFDYLYDPASGFVGYASVDPTYASVTPMVALIGTVGLADNFSSTYPTYLFGPTTLLEAGTGTISAVVSGSGGLTIGSGTVILQGVNTYLGGTTVTGGATLGIQADSGLGDASGGLTLNNGSLLLQGSFATARAITLGAGGGAILTNGNTLTVDQGISGIGGLLVSGSGQVVMTAANSYTGATMVNAGSTLALTGAGSIASSSGLTNNGTFDISGASSTVSLTSLAGNGAVNLGSRTLAITNGNGIFSGVIGGSGGLTVAGGFLGLTGSNTYTGMTNVTGGTLAVNGSIASTVTTAAGGTLTGSGQITGDVVSYGTFAPGNPYGTMTVNGDLAQTQGSTQYASVNSSGQVGNALVTGTASLQGGTVSVAAAPGSYAPSTTYRILRANGGLSGTYSSVTSSLPFLLPSLSYDANDAYVTLQIGGFQKAAQTPTQAAVAAALNASAQTATGDYATVMSAFSSLSTGQMSGVLNALSGQNYAAFSTSMTQSAQMFMNNFLSQAGGGSRTGGGGSRVALAEACDVESACDTTTPAKWGAWGGGVGGVGSVGAGTGTGAVTYNLGGFAAGLDRQITETFLAGVAVGYTSGQQWVSGFSGSGLSNSYQVSLYGSYSEGPVYADGLAGYAYSSNQMWRTIAVPGLAVRTAQATTGANQFFGQVEGGYRFAFGSTGDTTLAPFARLQGSTVTQNGFTETGAQSLNLTVAPQTTNSLRSVLGAQLAGTAKLGWREPLALQVKLGWSHEYANPSLPVTATLAGAPSTAFTTYGVSPKRDGVLVGMGASTAIAQATSVYARYEGLLSGTDSSHAFTAGVRMTW